MEQSIDERARFDRIRYANCWEDADVLCEALRPGPGRRILSIASGGDNVFALLAEGAPVVAVDVSPAQIALVDLKAAAIRHLDHADALAFLGVKPSDRRTATLRSLEASLSDASVSFWRDRTKLVENGVIHQGKFENYFRLFRRYAIRWVHGPGTIRELLREKDGRARNEFYATIWDNRRWRLMFRIFFSRSVMGRLGRDPEFFRYVDGAAAARILERTKYAFTVLPTHANPYLEYILTGNYSRRLPRYLRPGVFESVRDRLDGLTLLSGSIEAALRSSPVPRYHGFNLSDVFEYLDPAACRAIHAAVLDAAEPGARIAYWNMLVPRSCPEDLAERVRVLDSEAADLFRRDLAFFYSAFVLEEVRG